MRPGSPLPARIRAVIRPLISRLVPRRVTKRSVALVATLAVLGLAGASEAAVALGWAPNAIAPSAVARRLTRTSSPEETIVWGPRRFETPSGAAQEHIERIVLARVPGKLYNLRMRREGTLTTASVALNGVRLAVAADFASTNEITRVIDPRGDDTLTVTVAGGAGAALTISELETRDATFLVFGPQQYVRTAGTPDRIQVTFPMASTAAGPYRMCVKNGTENGDDRLSSSRIWVNGAEALGSNDLNQQVAGLVREVSLQANNVVDIELRSTSGAYLTVCFTATDVTPPVLSVTEPMAGLITRAIETRVAGTVEDQTATQVTVDGQIAERTGTAFSRLTTLTVEGENLIRVRAEDAAGLITESVISVIRDTESPIVTWTAPGDAVVTRNAVLAVSGTITDRTTVSANVNGIPLVVDPLSGAFTGELTLVDGPNFLTLTATDAAGNATSLVRQATLDVTPPTLAVTEPADAATVDAERIAVRGSVQDATALTLTVNGAAVTIGGDGSFSTEASLVEGPNTLTVAATDAAGNVSTVTRTVTRAPATLPGEAFPIDRALGAPAVSATAATNVPMSTAFLYSGANPVQTGVAAGTIVPVRAAVVRGRVLSRDGAPISGVEVTIADHPEFGRTVTRSNGLFDMAVNGGGLLRVQFDRDDFLPAARQLDVPWQDYAVVDDVMLVQLDANVTHVDFTQPMTVARGGVVTDESGTRQATLLFAQGTTAEMVMADGSRQPLPAIDVRATEYTVGPNGPKAMPAPLPPTSGYTYAAELSADQAIAAGATRVEFSRPVAFYQENFLGFPTGMQLPLGVYDPKCGCWIPEADGRVVKVVGVTGGLAELDVTGSGTAATASALAALGVTDAERQQVASLYQVGQSLWRVPVRHFSSQDINLSPQPSCPAPGVPDPNNPNAAPSGCGESPSEGAGEPEQEDEPPPEDECKKRGSSWISCQTQSLGEALRVVGTALQLVYESSRMPAREAQRTVQIPLVGETVPPGVKRVELIIDVAGRRIEREFEPQANQRTTFVWDGLDAYGRPVVGGQTITVRTAYVYNGVYEVPAARAASFGLPSGVAGTIPTRDELKFWSVKTLSVGTIGTPSYGVGGWSLNVHHTYDPQARMLYRGDGERVSAQVVRSAVSRIAGIGRPGFGGDGGPALDAAMAHPRRLTFGADGSLYVLEFSNARVRKIAPNGIITTVAGGGGSLSEGIPATTARLIGPTGLAMGPDGNLYIADNGARRIRKVSPDGIITTIAGTGGSGFSGDGGPAMNATFVSPHSVAVGPDCAIYIAEISGRRIRRIGPDGIITTYVGTGVMGTSGDGGPATLARIGEPLDLQVTSDGTLYFADYQGGFTAGSVRKVTPDGIITKVAGNASGTLQDGALAANSSFFVPGSFAISPDGSVYISQQVNNLIWRVAPNGRAYRFAGNTSYCSYLPGVETCGDGQAPLQAAISEPMAIRFGPDGSLYVLEWTNSLIKRILPTMPGFSGGTLLVADGGGAELYEMDLAGRHLRTLDALSGTARYRFEYDAAGRLVRVTDGDDRVTTVERTPSGAPSALVAPNGQRTALEVTPAGFLSRVVDPAGGAYTIAYAAGGLMTSVTDPRSKASQYTHDDLGRIVRAEDAEGGATIPTRTAGVAGHTSTIESATGVTTQLRVEDGPEGGFVERRTDESGLTTTLVHRPNGLSELTEPGGTVTSVTLAADPRLGLASPFAASTTVRMPSGLMSTLDRRREAVLANRADPLSLVSEQEFVTLNGQTTTVAYDAGTRTVTETSPEGRVVTTRMDDLKRPLEVRRPGLAAETFSYDELGRLASIVQGGRSAQFTYDARSRLATVAGALGREVRFEYDDAGRPTRHVLPGGGAVTLTYDARGNLTSLAPPGRPAHSFKYNDVNLVTEVTTPEVSGASTVARLTYDLDRRLTEYQRADGSRIPVTYDAAGRMATMGLSRGTLRHTYSPVTGRLTGVTAPDGGQLGLTYDGSLPLEQSWTGAVAGRVAFSFDAALRVSGITLNGSNVVDLRYDGDGLLVGAGAISLVRNPTSGFVSSTTLGGTTTTYTYTPTGELASVHTQSAQGSLFVAQYTHDALGRITRVVETIQGAVRRTDYGFDPAGRLASETRDGVVTASYEYDANGNRVRHTTANGVSLGTYDARDRIVTYADATYDHLPDGELATKTTAMGTTRYMHDEFGSLLGVTLPSGRRIEYVVDGWGRRIGRKIDGVLTQGFLYQSRLAPAAELDGSSNVVSRFVYARRTNVPDYMIKGGATYLLVTDQLGSVRLVVNAATGAVAQRLDYDAFGRVTLNSNPGFQPFGFAGGMYDHETGLVRFGARDYDPQTGRWTTKDPTGFLGDANLYAYSRNDPINLVDQTGAIPVGVAVGAAVGAVGGCAWTAYQTSQCADADKWDVMRGCAKGALGGMIAGALAGVGNFTGATTWFSGTMAAGGTVLGSIAQGMASDSPNDPANPSGASVTAGAGVSAVTGAVGALGGPAGSVASQVVDDALEDFISSSAQYGTDEMKGRKRESYYRQKCGCDLY